MAASSRYRGNASSSSSSSGDNGLEQLIPVINKLQDVFNALGSDVPLDLPQIVVVGSQSSGKSSVLEHIVGKDFLPRGSGIVTRRPLVLQLVNVPASSKKDGKYDEWGEFLHKPSEVFYNFSKIREEIAKETDRLTGKNKGISAQPINLKIFSPKVLNLTLVDLPGMTRVPVGDQPPDIEQQIRRMIYQFIRRKNAIILAVTPANTDVATSDALQMSKEVDPEGLRTLGVLTKIDIMDKGTNVVDLLSGRVVPLKLGFVGVINRSQQDIVANLPISEALRNEAKFFSEHPHYRKLAPLCGTPYLARTLNKRLLQHIRSCLPELKTKLSTMMADAQKEMLTYGDPLLDNEKGALLLQIITRFCSDYQNAIEGKSTDLSIHELCGGARINYIFTEIFSKRIDTFNPLDGLTMNDIRTAIRNATGPRTALFIPEDSFELLVKRQIIQLEDPAIHCVEYVYDELKRIVTQLESKELSRFNNLCDRVVEVMHRLLNECRRPTEQMIGNLIAMEMAYVNTSHPDFVGGGGAINSLLTKVATTSPQTLQPHDDGHHQQQQQQQIAYEQEQREREQREREEQARRHQPSRPNKPPPGSTGGRGNPGRRDNFFGMFFGKQDSSPSNAPPARRQPTPTPHQQPPSRTTDAYQARAVEHSSRRTATSSSRSTTLDQVPQSLQHAANDKDRFETELIQQLLMSYFDIVRKNIKDMVPKSCMHFLVNASKKNVQNKLISELYNPDLFDELLEESPEIAQRRTHCKQLLDTLRKANEILNEVRDSSF